jgi:hypothetical protein
MEDDDVSVAAQLERLVRIVPGVAGYQDRENARETDKLVRMRLSDEIRRLMRDLELDKRRLADAAKLELLPVLDRLAGKLETHGRTAEFELPELEALYAFDLRLFGTLTTIKAKAKVVHESLGDPAALTRAAHDLETALDDLERTVDARRQVLAAGV